MSVETAKYLGITFDNRLSFEKHINNLVKKLSKAVGILCKVKNFLNSQALLQLYYAIFPSHLQYGLIIWGSTFKTYLKKLTTLQNKAVKIVGGGKYFDHATPYYSKLRILKLVDLLKSEKALFVFKYRSKALPSALKIIFLQYTMTDLHGRLSKLIILFPLQNLPCYKDLLNIRVRLFGIL